MSWNDFNIAIGEMLNKDRFAYNPKKKVFTKLIGTCNTVVDISNEEIYFFDGTDKITKDHDGIMAGIMEKIESIVVQDIPVEDLQVDNLPDFNLVIADEPKSQNKDIEEPIKTADTLQDDEHTEIAKNALGPIITHVDVEPIPVPIVPQNAPVLPPQPYKPQGTIIHGFVPQLKEIGKIKIGRKGETRQGKSGEYRLPEKFDHFEIVSLLKDEHGNFIPDKIMGSLDSDPKELDIILLYNDPTLNFFTRYNEYKGGKCVCRGDGKLATDINDNKISCNPETCPKFLGKTCKAHGILSVILTKSPRLGGVYKFRTTGWNSIRSILSSMMFLQTATGGTLAGIPLKLTLTPQQAQPKNSPTAHTIYVVNLEYAGTMEQLLNETIKTIQTRHAMQADIQRLESTARLALDAPETEEEIEDIEAEWYPDGGAT